MRVRVIFVAILTLLLAGNLSAAFVSLRASGQTKDGPIAFERIGEGFFVEAFVLKDGAGQPFHLVMNFGNNLGSDVFRWEMQWMAPEGQEILAKTYPNVKREIVDRKTSGFMSLVAGGTDKFLCNGDAAASNRSFSITKLTYLDDGQVDEFALVFNERCDDTTLSGTVVFAVNGTPTDGGGDDGGDGGTTGPPVPFQIQLPDDFDVEPLVLTNSGTKTIDFKTAVDQAAFNSDLNLSVSTDAFPHEDFHATVTPAQIKAPGAGDAKLTITTGPLTFPRVYQVTLTAASIDVTTQIPISFSRTFLVHVTCDPPIILGVNQPKNITAANGSQVTLEVKPTGSGPFFYQWYKGFPGMTRSPVLAANESRLIFTTRETATYWVRVTNACGTVDSNAVTVTTTGSLAGPARRRS